MIEPDRWRLTDRVDASLTVLAALDHDVSRRGAFLAYIGSGEYPVTMRVLGAERLVPGATGAVRLFLPDGLPLLPGDRYVLRESGRDETIGGGEILDIDPVLKASVAAPDRTIERLVRERGWIRVSDVEALTGERVAPTIGDWLTTPAAIEQMEDSLRARLDDGGSLGIDIARLDDRERAVLATMQGIVVDRGRARLEGADTLLAHPGLARLREGGFVPSPPDDIDRATLSELVRLGHVVVRDGIYFHRDTIDRAGSVAADLLRADAGRLHRRRVPGRHRSEPALRAPAAGRTRRPWDDPAAGRPPCGRAAVGPARRRVRPASEAAASEASADAARRCQTRSSFRRSTSVNPPHTPYRSPLRTAWSRHSARTSHPAHTCLARCSRALRTAFFSGRIGG